MAGTLHPSQEAERDECPCSVGHIHDRSPHLSKAFVVTPSQTYPEVCLPGGSESSEVDIHN